MTWWTNLLSRETEIVLRPIGFEPRQDVDRRREMDQKIASGIEKSRESRYESLRAGQDTVGYMNVMSKWAQLVRDGR